MGKNKKAEVAEVAEIAEVAEVAKAEVEVSWSPNPPETTEEELMAQLQDALATRDFKAVAVASNRLNTAVKAMEKALLEKKQKALDAMADKVKSAITLAIEPLLDSGELESADGVWYSYDFGEKAPVVRLMRTQPKGGGERKGGGGGGKKFDISTDEMLEKHGEEEFKNGLTLNQAYESSSDKNLRFSIRKKLLKLEGLI